MLAFSFKTVFSNFARFTEPEDTPTRSSNRTFAAALNLLRGTSLSDIVRAQEVRKSRAPR